MANSRVIKLYAIIDKTSKSVIQLKTLNKIYDDSDPEPTLNNTANEYYQEVTLTDLAGLSPQEFLSKKTPVIVDSAFSSWADRAAPPIASIDVNPKADGSNTPTITISNGSANSNYKIIPSRNIDCNLTGLSGALDGTGGTTFKIRLYGLGNFLITISPDNHEDFEPVSLSITVDPGLF